MTRVTIGVWLLIVCGIAAAQGTLTGCGTGHTVIKVDSRIGAQTPFFAVFRIEGNTVTMTEGDTFRFVMHYQANAEPTRPGRPG